MGFNHLSSFGLIFSSIIGQFIAMITLGKMIWKEDNDKFKKYKLTRIIIMAKKYKNFPKYDIPSALMNTLSTNGFILIFAKIFGSSF